MSQHFEATDPWETTPLVCPQCGWTGTFMQGATEAYEELIDSQCPKCPRQEAPVLAIVSYATKPPCNRRS